MPETPQRPLRISSATAAFMIAVAVLFDSLQFFLALLIIGVLADTLISVLAWAVFWLWFKLKGVSILWGRDKPARRALLAGATALGEFLPLFNVLPAWTGFVAMIIHQSRKEDRVQYKT